MDISDDDALKMARKMLDELEAEEPTKLYSHGFGRLIHALLPEKFGFILVIVEDKDATRAQALVTDGDRDEVIHSLRRLADSLESKDEVHARFLH